ncbi:2'-5' RNA ligase family protein [Pedobacter agri]|uniref:2'-5' RNA ligase family protein n=1 Tax=Pedobacter agri TaxID=454586 RepID=UPI00292F4F46|nr:2'-5' RNA ligase family protein [Pedobacter agri]
MGDHIYNEYLGIISPNKSVKSDIESMKKRCKDDYGWTSSAAHFTVFNLLQPTSNEKRFLLCFERNISNISPFEINLCGFDYFSGPTYTLYVKLKDENEFSKRVQYIRKFCKPILKSVKNYLPRYNTKNAHLTIVKGISMFDFLKAWPSWENLRYESSTTADRILLLKRPFTEANPNFEIIGEYPFLGQGPLKPQITLF